MSEGYLRQRRNLLSICIFILLAILGGSKINPYFPFQLERPYVAEIFVWIGFFYFWYRSYIYGPGGYISLFKNEIILDHIRKYQQGHYVEYNLSSFIGEITTTRKENNRTVFKLTGVIEATGSLLPGDIDIPIAYDLIINTKNYFRYLLKGKVITDYVLPQAIAFVTLVIGIYFYICIKT